MRRLIGKMLDVPVRTAAALIVLVACGVVWAQSIPPGAAPSCDQQLELTRTENIALRKQLAQNMFQAAFLEEQTQAMKKQIDAYAAKEKAAEKK